MNWEQIKGDWKTFTGKVKEKWGDLTDDDLAVIEGQREQLVGQLQKRYGIAKEEAQRQVEEFEHSYSA
ncbi:MAG: CsbD family protein [Pirellulales bacterium]